MKTVENSYALASSVRDLNCRGIHLRWSFSLSLFDQRGSSAESLLFIHWRNGQPDVVEVVGVEPPETLNDALRSLAKFHPASRSAIHGFKVASFHIADGSEYCVVGTDQPALRREREHAEMRFEPIQDDVARTANLRANARLRDEPLFLNARTRNKPPLLTHGQASFLTGG